MRHRVLTETFGRSTAHRQAMLAAVVCGLITEKRVKTTLPKAKAARRLAERMVTLGKKGTLASRRRALAVLHRPTVVKHL
ncbi:MAG: bL17 family ribosomal protein, partial [Lentisphaerae bacterium]|nr:bL17 family ribosomal protein [Lentisphaerota bacterium]